MALPDISLDDRSFDQLFAFMRKQIDTSTWVDHNFSDPGIVLLDLLCWIGEMILYRADRVPEAHRVKFADLILDPPEPVTVPLTLNAALAFTRVADLRVPAGTRFATNFAIDANTGRARRYIFETLAPAMFRGPSNAQHQPPPPTTQTATVTAREYLAVENEQLGVSDGTAGQAFPLRPVHTDLGLPLDALAPVLLDFDHTGADYIPNPRVTVGGQPWALKQFLLTEDSRITGANPNAQHFMVDAEERRIRFGDGKFGSIPVAGAAIVCTRYQLLQGPDALTKAAVGTIVNRLDPIVGLANNEKIDPANGDAEGGGFFFSPDMRLREGLKRFRRPHRLITASDFDQVMLIDFNERQGLANRPDKVLRATTLMNRRPQAPQQASPGSVTIVVLAERQGVDLDSGLTDPTLSTVQKLALVALSPGLVDSIERFLDKRRLITTRTYVQPPALTPFSINAQVTVAGDRSTSEMTDIIGKRIRAFLGVAAGGFDGKGWPLGGGIYRSKLFRLIEDLDGVDHVDSLVLSPPDSNGDVPLGPLSLPALAGLSIGVTRL